MKRHLFPILLSTSASVFAVAANAQTGETATVPSDQAAPEVQEGLADIVVTARKREESLQDVPVAVSAITGEALRNNLASDLNKIAELAPQVSVGQGGSGTGAAITIRGVSSASNDAGLDQSVAIEFDGIPLSRGNIITAAMFDIAGVQVLQGPQALFFGKNSPAGVISIRSASPGNEFEGYVTAGYEFEAREKYVEGAVSGPLSDVFGARLAFRASDMRGWIRNTATPRVSVLNPAVTVPGALDKWGPGDEKWAVRGTLSFTPSTTTEATLKVSYNENSRTMYGSEGFCADPNATPVLLGNIPLPNADCRKDRRAAVSAVAPIYTVNFPYTNGGRPYIESKILLASLNMTQEFDGGSLNSSTGYYRQTTQQMNVSDWGDYSSIWASYREKYELFTQELRLDSDFDGPLNFMVGAYFEHYNRPYFNAPNLFNAFNPAANNYASVMMNSKGTGDYASAFAQARWQIMPNLELSAGARYSWDSKQLTITNTEVAPSQPNLRARGVPLRSEYQDRHISPEATLTWHPIEDHTLYGAYKTGYKGGGISNPFLLSRFETSTSLQFQPEEAEGFEVGYKALLFDRRLRFDIVAYDYKYDNLQVVSYNPVTITFILQNAAAAKIRGAQGSFNFLAAKGLTFNGNIGINSAKFTEFLAPCYAGQTVATGCTGTPGRQDLAGRRLLRAPKLTWSLGAEYETPVSDGWGVRLSAQVSRVGSYETAGDFAPLGFQEGFYLLNASATIKADAGFELSIIGRNLTDTYYMLNSNGWSGSLNPNQQIGFFNRPREIALQGTFRF